MSFRACIKKFFSNIFPESFLLSILQNKKQRPDLLILNYHGTPKNLESELDWQFRVIQKYFKPIDFKEIIEILEKKRILSDPSIFITFDDGRKDNVEVALPLLKKYGLRAGFFPVTNFIGASQVKDFVQKNQIFQFSPSEIPLPMTKEEVCQLSKDYLIGAHSRNHVRLGPGLSTHLLEEEILGSAKDLGLLTAKKINSFCWVGGEIKSYSKEAFQIIQKNFDYSFINCHGDILRVCHPHLLYRTNVEASFSRKEFLLSLSGFYRFAHWKKDQKIKRIFGLKEFRS